MNILYIGFDIEGVGGIATYSRYQIQALRGLGHRVHVLSVNKQELHVDRGLIDRNLPFVNKYSAALRLTRLILRERRRFDLVLFNHVYLAVAGYAARLAGGPVYAINVYNIDILERLPGLRERAFAGASLVIADCQYTIDRLPQFHAKVPQTGLLYDPVDTQFFRPIPRDEARREVMRRLNFAGLDGKFIATTVANMILPPNKGHRQTIESLRKLNDPRFLYVVVGEGPDRLPIADYAAQNGVAAQVKFTGLVDQSALPYLYSAADVAVLVAHGGPGRGEAVPLGLIEASACAVAFICGNEDGSVEAINPARPNGIAIDPGSSDALAAALKALADDPAKTAEMGANGRQFVDDVFRFEKFTERQGELIDRFIAPLVPAAARRKVEGNGGLRPRPSDKSP